MERLEPFGYVSAHPEKKFPVLPTDTSNFFIECIAQHDGKKQLVSVTDIEQIWTVENQDWEATIIMIYVDYKGVGLY